MIRRLGHLARLALVPFLTAALLLAACGSDEPAATDIELEARDDDSGSADEAPDAGEPGDEQDDEQDEGSEPDDTGNDLLAALAKAADDTLAVGSARFEAEVSVTPPATAGVDPIVLTMGGVLDFTTGRAEFAMDLRQLIPADEIPPGMLGALSEPMRLVQDGTVVYSCGAFIELMAGAECVREDAAAAGGASTGGIGAGLSFDAQLGTLAGLTDLEDLGVERILGTTTRHYRGSFTLRDAAATLPPDDLAELEQSLGSVGASGDALLDTPQQIDVWIDADGLVRQLRQTTTFPAPLDMTMVMEVRYVELDVAADIQVPTDFVDAASIPGF